LAKSGHFSPVATGPFFWKMAIFGHFWRKRPKKAFLRVLAHKRAFWPFLGPLAQGFYINPSRRGPAVPGGPGPWPRVPLPLQGAGGAAALLWEVAGARRLLLEELRLAERGTNNKNRKYDRDPKNAVLPLLTHALGPRRPGVTPRDVASGRSRGAPAEPRGPAARG